MFKRCAQIQSNWNVRNLCENKLDMCTKSGGGQWKNYSKFEYANELNWPRWRRRPWTRDPCSGGEAGDWGTRPEVEWRRREPQSASTGAAWAWAWVAPSDDTDRRLPCDCCPFWRWIVPLRAHSCRFAQVAIFRYFLPISPSSRRFSLVQATFAIFSKHSDVDSKAKSN